MPFSTGICSVRHFGQAMVAVLEQDGVAHWREAGGAGGGKGMRRRRRRRRRKKGKEEEGE